MNPFLEALCTLILDTHTKNSETRTAWRTRIAAVERTDTGIRLWSPYRNAVIYATPHSPVAWTVTVHKFGRAVTTKDPDMFILAAMVIHTDNPDTAPGGTFTSRVHHTEQHASTTRDLFRWVDALLEALLTAEPFNPPYPGIQTSNPHIGGNPYPGTAIPPHNPKTPPQPQVQPHVNPQTNPHHPLDEYTWRRTNPKPGKPKPGRPNQKQPPGYGPDWHNK